MNVYFNLLKEDKADSRAFLRRFNLSVFLSKEITWGFYMRKLKFSNNIMSGR